MERPLSMQLRKSTELTHELKRYQWDILGLTEVRWTEFGETVTDEGHKNWYCGEDSKHQYGVASIVRKEVVVSIISMLHSHVQHTHLHPDLSETTQHQSFRYMRQPKTTKTRRSNSSTSSLIVHSRDSQGEGHTCSSR